MRSDELGRQLVVGQATSFAVVFGGLLFQSGSQALRAGTLESWAMTLVDVLVTFIPERRHS